MNVPLVAQQPPSQVWNAGLWLELTEYACEMTVQVKKKIRKSLHVCKQEDIHIARNCP